MAVAVTPDGRRAVSASVDKTLKVWDLNNGGELLTLRGHTEAVRAVAVTPGRTAGGPGLPRWRAESVEPGPGRDLLSTLSGHTTWVSAVALTPDGRLAASASGDRTVKVWDLDSEQELVSLAARLVLAIIQGQRELRCPTGRLPVENQLVSRKTELVGSSPPLLIFS